MLRFHFTAEDLTRIRVAKAPDPLWEIAFSLHRLQTRDGRWAYAHWHRTTRIRLRESGLAAAVQGFLLPLFPRARYFPDFLTPAEGAEGLDAGLDAMLATPRKQVIAEAATLAGSVGAPSWVSRLADNDMRDQLVRALRAYHRAVIAPYEEHIGERVQAERIRHARSLLDHGTAELISSLAPTIRWRHPVLEIAPYPEERDVHLNGRGLLLIPSYFCWQTPISLADPGLPTVIAYPLQPDPVPTSAGRGQPLTVLLGRSRAGILRATITGATTTEAARHAGVSPATATHHTTALRNTGLINSDRWANTVLHTLTPLGAALLTGAQPDRPSGAHATLNTPPNANHPS
ncbi:winged helix-turn-helix domain-containing protein [Streptomyces sp. NPDC057438]|uniref:winged helix-turn-helix domain-containing protein n=1 Tax=Streptomyces sp. NPDC057438 TaxID=3346133 RepID=UPI0036C639B8